MADITPVTREEFYLAKAGGQDVPVPSAVTREEYYLEKLSNDSVVVPTPVTRREKFLYFACGGEIDLPSEEKMTRLERLIAKAGGMEINTPTAVTRLEKFWANVEGGGWTVSTLTGTLPMTFRSNGTALINYRIYGVADGAGVQTKNLFNYRKEFDDGAIIYNQYFKYYNLQLKPNTTYTAYTNAYSQYTQGISNYETSVIITADEITFNTTNGGVIQHSPRTITTLDSGIVKVGIRIGWSIGSITNPLYNESDFATSQVWLNLVEGSEVPFSNIPYGYKVPLEITSGADSKTADVYIGDSKLLSADYIDYESGKIVRNGTPQDPPLPLPAIETFKGTNTLDSTETLGEVTIKGKIKEVE